MNDRTDPFDELAALFLTEPDGASPLRPAATPLVELIVVGSLPVRASLWLVPYADAVAREIGPTALVRLDQPEPTIQLLRTRPDVATRRWPAFADAIADLGRHVGNWLIRPEYDVTPRQLVEAAADRVTVLSSVNDSAIVKAYQEIKLLSAAAKPGAPLPGLGVAVLGADYETAARFHGHLRHTTASFLRTDLSMVACVPRADGATGSPGPVTFPREPYPSLEDVLAWVRAARAAPAPAAEQTPRRHRVVEAPPEQEPPRERQPPPEAPAIPSIKLVPKPRVEVEPKPETAAREPDEAGAAVPLAQYVDDVWPLDARSPGHEWLELAVDAAGRLHVMAREPDMRALHVVVAWAAAHAELIGKACPGHWIDPAASPVLHVFTDRPASLADLHGCALRLHVLAPVTVDGRRGWYHARLNGEAE